MVSELKLIKILIFIAYFLLLKENDKQHFPLSLDYDYWTQINEDFDIYCPLPWL